MNTFCFLDEDSHLHFQAEEIDVCSLEDEIDMDSSGDEIDVGSPEDEQYFIPKYRGMNLL